MIHITNYQSRKGFTTWIDSIRGLVEIENKTGIKMNVLKIEKGWPKPEETPSGNR